MIDQLPMEAARAIKNLENNVSTAFNDAINTLYQLRTDIQAVNPNEQALNALIQNKKELERTLGLIERQLMWSPYIAFFGETNAGKSTIIEALRLYFGENIPDVGASIGDGRSDFTQEAGIYPCTFRGRAFTLVDVPGIEGNERVVEEAVRSALTRSQVVFYITPDARAPQGGEDGREGTLEKIARQLKPQAKIWSIWNKKVHTPRMLAKPLLVEGSDEWRSLNDDADSLHAKMREVLGSRYQTCLPVTARPAFLALAIRSLPGSKLARERARFLDHFTEEQLLKASGIDEVVDLCIGAIPSAAEIFQANFGKLTIPIADCADGLLAEAKTNFMKPASELKAAIKKLEPTLENIAGDARRNLHRLSDALIQKTVASVRSQMMDSIKAGIDTDSDLRRQLEAVLQREKLILEKKIMDGVRKIVSDARESYVDALKVMKAELVQADTFSVPGFTANFDHTVEVETKGGVDWVGLGTTVAAGVVATLLTGGWVLVLGMVGVLMGAWNALAAFFDPDCKKDQQKKVLNANLHLVSKELSIKIPKEMNKLGDEIETVLKLQVQHIRRLCVHYHKSGEILLGTGRYLSVLSASMPPYSPPEFQV